MTDFTPKTIPPPDADPASVGDNAFDVDPVSADRRIFNDRIVDPLLKSLIFHFRIRRHGLAYRAAQIFV